MGRGPPLLFLGRPSPLIFTFRILLKRASSNTISIESIVKVSRLMIKFPVFLTCTCSPPLLKRLPHHCSTVYNEPLHTSHQDEKPNNRGSRGQTNSRALMADRKEKASITEINEQAARKRTARVRQAYGTGVRSHRQRWKIGDYPGKKHSAFGQIRKVSSKFG